MYVTSNQIQYGVIRFVTQDMIPKVDGWRRVVLGASLDLVSGQELARQILSSPYFGMLGIKDENDMIDIDRLKNAVEKQIGTQKIDINIPVIGVFKIGQPDIERLCNIIKQGDDM